MIFLTLVIIVNLLIFINMGVLLAGFQSTRFMGYGIKEYSRSVFFSYSLCLLPVSWAVKQFRQQLNLSSFILIASLRLS
jgi:hypothetical protein